jgi:hypothetical protein
MMRPPGNLMTRGARANGAAAVGADRVEPCGWTSSEGRADLDPLVAKPHSEWWGSAAVLHPRGMLVLGDAAHCCFGRREAREHGDHFLIRDGHGVVVDANGAARGS